MAVYSCQPSVRAGPARLLDGAGASRVEGTERRYVLFEYVVGVGKVPTNAGEWRTMGRALASFHRLAAQFRAPPRFKLAPASLVESALKTIGEGDLLGSQDLSFVTQFSARLRQRLSSLPTTTTQVIHGDFWWGNIGLSSGRATILNFDFCGHGLPIYDVASFLGTAEALAVPVPPGGRRAFLAGYEGVRSLAAWERAACADLELTRALYGLGWWATLATTYGREWFLDSAAGEDV
jgi:Ser/Thr protein kinase RdoA (MazF antagonist)